MAEVAMREADRGPLARKQATAQWRQGLVRADPAGVLTAAGSLRDAGLPMYAGAFEDAAVLLAQAGTVSRARMALGDALQLHSQIGAAWDARGATSRVRQWGTRSVVRGPRRRPRTGWEALTEIERQVAGLVAAGYSNPIIAGAAVHLTPYGRKPCLQRSGQAPDNVSLGGQDRRRAEGPRVCVTRWPALRC